MARTLRNRKLAGPTAGNTTAVTLYTVATNLRARINKLTVLNTNSTTARLLTVYLVPSGDSAADANALIKQVGIGPYEAITVAEAISHLLDEGDSVQFLQDTGTDLIAHLSGTEYLV
jgi:hypothetical protein